MDSVIPTSFSRYPLAPDCKDTLIGVFPTSDEGVFVVYESVLMYSRLTSIRPYIHQSSSPIVAATLLYPGTLLYMAEHSIYECHVTDSNLSTSVQLQLTDTYPSSEIFCIATSSAGLFAYCALRADNSLVIMIYEDECTSALPNLKHLCTVMHKTEMSPATLSHKLKASFDPSGLFLAVHISAEGNGSYLLILADASSSHFDVTFAKQLNFSSELRAQFKQELARDQAGWVPCSWRKLDRPMGFHGFTTNGRFLLMTCQPQLQPGPCTSSATEVHTGCCQTASASTMTCGCASATTVTQKYIPYEGRGIALESIEDVSWTPSSYMEEHGDLQWYKQFYGVPANFIDNLSFSANTMAIYPSSVCFYDPLVLRNPHIVFPLRTPNPNSQYIELVTVQGVRLNQGHHVLVLYRGQGFYCIAVYVTASYTWRLAAEIMVPCCSEIPIGTPSYVSENGRIFCVTSPHFLLATALSTALQQSFTGTFARIQDGMVVHTDVTSFTIPPPAYNTCILRTIEPLIATCIIQRRESSTYIAVLTRTKLCIILVSPFDSLALVSEAPAIAGDTSFKEQEMLIQSDSIVARVMKGNKKAHFLALNDLEDTGQRNVSYDIVTKEELLVDPFRSDQLQEHILTHTSSTLLEIDIISQLSDDLLRSILHCGGSPIIFPVALHGPTDLSTVESQSIAIQLLGTSIGYELVSVTLKIELTLVSDTCSLQSIVVFYNHEQSYEIPLSVPKFGISLEPFRRCFYLKGLVKEKEEERESDISIVSFSEFSSFYWVARDTSAESTWLLFVVTRTSPQLVVYLIDADASEHTYKPVYSCNIEPWSTILYATELSVVLYTARGYLDIKHPSKLSYFKAQSLLKQALSLNSSVEEILELCFESRLLLSSLDRGCALSETDIVTYFRLLLSSNPTLLLRALEAVVCPHEMKVCTAVTFERYNTTEKHEADFWARLVDWIFGNIELVKELSAHSYKNGEDLHAAYLKSLLRILQLHAIYHSGFTKGFGYQNRGGQERTFIELSAAFASAYIASPGVEGGPSLMMFVTHLASAATSYQMNLVQLLQATELYLFQQAHYVDMHIVADAMGLPISAVATSCLGLAEISFSKCRADPLLRACAYLAMVSAGIYTVYTQEDQVAFYGAHSSATFPFISSRALKYQHISIFAGLDITYYLISQILMLLNTKLDDGTIKEINPSIFRFAGWDREQIALGALHYFEDMLDSNMSLLIEVLPHYPLAECIIRMATLASTISVRVGTALLELFLPVCEKLKDRSMADQIYLLLDAIAMAIQLHFMTEPDQLGTGSEYEKNALALQTLQLKVCKEPKPELQTSMGIQHALTHLVFNALSPGVSIDPLRQTSATYNAIKPESKIMSEILLDLKEIEASDALFKILYSLLAHNMLSADQVLQFLKSKLVTEGIQAMEAQIISQKLEINALHKQYQIVRAKMDACSEKHDNQTGKNTRLHQLDEKMKQKRGELDILTNQIHDNYKSFAMLLCFCFIV